MDIEKEKKDYLNYGTAGRAPVFDEPVLDSLADKATKDLKDKPAVELTANDKFILGLVEKLPVGDLLMKGYMQINVDLGNNISCTLRTLVFKQVEDIASDVSRFQQQVELEKSKDGLEREVWRPSSEEVRIFQMKRTLAEVVYAVGEMPTGNNISARMMFFENLDSMLFNAIYRRVQQFFTAVSLLFPSDNQKELVSSLKKAYAPLQ